jgi:hypothetical protein
VLSADPVSRGLDGVIVRETILAGETVYRAAAESVEASASTRQAPAAI